MKTSARDFFLHLGVTVTLYVSVVSLLTLLFQIVNLSFPDILQNQYYYVDPYSTGLRWAIASLFIVFPLYLILSWIINRDYRREPAKRDLWIRKWLIYITLFAAGIALAIDLITLIHYFLGGEITVRFILKVLAVLIVTAAVFSYYLYDVRRDRAVDPKRNKLYAVIAVAVVIASIVGGFLIMGSPFTVRLIRFDERKQQDLDAIQWQVVEHWRRAGVLPANLADLDDSISGYRAPLDPQTNQAYEYRVINQNTFELCAEFNLPTSADRRRPEAVSLAYPVSPRFGNWEHETGRTCFEREIDPQAYPLYKEVPVR